MSLVHPMQRIQVAAIVFAVLGGTLLAVAEPASTAAPEPWATRAAEPARSVVTVVDVQARRAWREHLPAVFLLRRRRPA